MTDKNVRIVDRLEGLGRDYDKMLEAILQYDSEYISSNATTEPEPENAIAEDIVEHPYAWLYCNELGSYILCTDCRHEDEALEGFSEAFLRLGYTGLIHDSEAIGLGDAVTEGEYDSIVDNYHAYNRGEYWLDYPVMLKRIY